MIKINTLYISTSAIISKSTKHVYIMRFESTKLKCQVFQGVDFEAVCWKQIDQ